MSQSSRAWRRRSYCGSAGNGGDCVEIAFTGSVAALRDSKNGGGSVVVVDQAQWTRFLEAIKHN